MNETPEGVVARLESLVVRMRMAGHVEASAMIAPLVRDSVSTLRHWEQGVHEASNREHRHLRVERSRIIELKERFVALYLNRAARNQASTGAFTPLVDGVESVAVYALVDPAMPDRIRYVGQTNAPHSRYRGHCRDLAWARTMVEEEGRRPLMLLIEWTPCQDVATVRERYWIHHFRSLGMADLNRAGCPSIEAPERVVAS